MQGEAVVPQRSGAFVRLSATTRIYLSASDPSGVSWMTVFSVVLQTVDILVSFAAARNWTDK